jgi:putative acetyltransferase
MIGILMLRYCVVESGDEIEKVLGSLDGAANMNVFRLWIKEFIDGLKQTPEQYRPPRGCVLLAFGEDEFVGYVGFRPLSSVSCEMRCLIRRSTEWGKKVGRGLTLELLKHASNSGYKSMKLFYFPNSRDKLPKFYEPLGFVPCEPYCECNGAVFLEKSLESQVQ